MPVVGIYTKDFPDIGRALLDTDIVVVAIAGDNVTYRSTVGAVRTALKVTITNTSDSNGEYDASGDGVPDFPVFTVYEGANTIPASYDNTTKIISGLNPSTAFTAKFI
jgi:hypothetical protein